MKPMLWPALLLTLTILPLSGQPGPGRSPRIDRIGHTLNLSETQMASIQRIREKHRADLVHCRGEVRQTQTTLRTALLEAATPETQLRALNDKASAARFELLLARRSVHQEVQAVLTPDQRVKAAELRGMAQARRRERLRHLCGAAGMPR
jgi:Spy/CpxP family protein refolding chaperone